MAVRVYQEREYEKNHLDHVCGGNAVILLGLANVASDATAEQLSARQVTVAALGWNEAIAFTTGEITSLLPSANVVRLDSFESFESWAVKTPGTIIVVGHGMPYGLEFSTRTASWEDVGSAINRSSPHTIVVASCYSRGLESVLPGKQVFGFRALVDVDEAAYISAAMVYALRGDLQKAIDLTGELTDIMWAKFFGVSDHPILTLSTPTVGTRAASNVGQSQATLNMVYDFKDVPGGSVRFRYRVVNGNWVMTSWVSRSGAGTYSEVVSGLDAGVTYEFYAELMWYNPAIHQPDYVHGNTLTFTTSGTYTIGQVRGIWHVKHQSSPWVEYTHPDNKVHYVIGPNDDWNRFGSNLFAFHVQAHYVVTYDIVTAAAIALALLGVATLGASIIIAAALIAAGLTAALFTEWYIKDEAGAGWFWMQNWWADWYGYGVDFKPGQFGWIRLTAYFGYPSAYPLLYGGKDLGIEGW